jgi:virginiamycin A acetyltransferase
VSIETGPSTISVYPIKKRNQLCFLKNVVKNTNIQIGDYTYYDYFQNVYNFEKKVRYLYDFSTDKLIIGRLSSIASDVEFIMNGGNHLTNSISS